MSEQHVPKHNIVPGPDGEDPTGNGWHEPPHNNAPGRKYVSRPQNGPDATALSLPLDDGPNPRHILFSDGHRVPYIEVRDVTAGWLREPGSTEVGTDSLPKWSDESQRLNKHAQERGERIFDLTLDGRFMITCTESELERWVFFLSHAMAVSAGYTSHGQNSRPINRHGPSRV